MNNLSERVKKDSLPKRYEPEKIEKKWQLYWQDHEVYESIFKFNKHDAERPPFVIDTPPPFTSGDLHIGQAYWICIADTFARYKRMGGYNVLLPQGWDCQGLPTELKVQNIWKIPRENRELFRKKCIEWTMKMIEGMKKTMLRLGYRPDWEQFEYRTMDTGYWRDVQKSLISFFEKGLIYRDAFPVHWCPNCETALAQAELGYNNRKGFLFFIKFPFKDSYVELATTRPELLSACQALVVNPKDNRYKKLVGEKAEIPLFQRKVPIIADPQVDIDFGTGVVMVCTFGDEQDIRWQQKYGLPISKVIDEHGKIACSGKYNGFNILEAREAIVSDLKNADMLSKKEEIFHQVLSHTERSDCMAPVEFLVKNQFFIKIKPFKKEVINACRSMRWLPEYMFQRLYDWVNSIEWDWIISRQRIYGTPLPFWYCSECNEIIPASVDQLPVETVKEDPPMDQCPECDSVNISASLDVCDCWVDSSITPLIITGFFKNEDYFKRAYPVNLRPQGMDIIRTWLYYTTLRCLILTDKPPFNEALIHGMILGPDGRNMSKSRGNVVDPEERIGEFGADSLRQALLSLTIGSDFPFKWEVVKYSKAFLQKYWSATRFCLQFFTKYEPSLKDAKNLNIIDRWVIANLVDTITTVTTAMDNYEFHTTLEAIQGFFWHIFCDQYLEAVKYRLYNKLSDSNFLAALYTLHTVLWNITLLLAPICPHITEEIYQALFRRDLLSIHAAKWPDIASLPLDEEAKNRGDVIMSAISRIRSEKSAAGIPLSASVERVTIYVPAGSFFTLKEVEDEIKNILHIKEILYRKGRTFDVEFN